MNIGIFGGTFDPIHMGHLITAQAVREIRKLDKIIFIPAHISPFKTERDSTSDEDRYRMLELALEGIEYFDISDLEIKKDKISYSIHTIKELKKKYDKIDLIIGYDNLLSFDKWKSPDELLTLVNLVVLRRKTEEGETSKNKYFKSAIFVETPLIEISGTEIRERVKQNLPIDFLVPKNVMEYIYNLKLYKE